MNLEPVLLLDSTYEPLRVISWTKAMTLLLTGSAEVIEEDEDRLIRSVSLEWKRPSVIRQLTKFRKKDRRVQFNRINIFMRDDWMCQYCRQKKFAKELTFDHILPKSHGGKTSWTNIVTACKPCNSRKDDRTPEQAGMHLFKLPEEPKWLPAHLTLKMKTLPKKWEPYMDLRALYFYIK